MAKKKKPDPDLELEEPVVEEEEVIVAADDDEEPAAALDDADIDALVADADDDGKTVKATGGHGGTVVADADAEAQAQGGVPAHVPDVRHAHRAVAAE